MKLSLLPALSLLIASTAFCQPPLPERCDRTTEVCFASEVSSDGGPLSLVGVGLFRYWGFKVYHVALYTPAGKAKAEDVLRPIPKRLTIHYFRDFTINDFRKSGRTVIGENPAVNPKLVASGLQQIDNLYQSIEPGDRYEVTFVPGQGTQLSKNGQLLGMITGSPEEIDEFQRAYFGIWLADRYAIDDDLRESILNL